MATPSDISAKQIAEVLTAHPYSDKREIVRNLLALGCVGVTTSSVNRVLYAHPKVFIWSSPAGSYRRLWYLRASAPHPHVPAPAAIYRRQRYVGGSIAGSTTPVSNAAPSLTFAERLQLYEWQIRAAHKWRDEQSRGIVEAVTGAGKTRLALHAVAGHLSRKWRVVTIVPNCELLNQWYKQYETHICGILGMNVRVGKMGGGHHAALHDHDIVVATVQSARACRLLPVGQRGLLIADECHHYGAEKWAKALQEGFEHRLGLTATYEREDDGCSMYIDPYFGKVVYSLGYTEALSDGVIADFRVVFVGARFLPDEQAAYDEYDRQASENRQLLVRKYGLPDAPFGEFMKRVTRLKNSNEGRASKAAGFYLSAFAKRRQIMAGATAKLQRVWELRQAVAGAERSIVFANTREAAHQVVGILSKAGIAGAVLDSTMDMDARRRVFGGFEKGEFRFIVAPVLLDEGVDVPSADLGIVLASFRCRRNLIQRMGRVLRLKKDGRKARIVVLFIEGTAEDPASGAREDFLDTIEGAASEVKMFPADVTGAEVCAYVNQFHAS